MKIAVNFLFSILLFISSWRRQWSFFLKTTFHAVLYDKFFPYNNFFSCLCKYENSTSNKQI